MVNIRGGNANKHGIYIPVVHHRCEFDGLNLVLIWVWVSSCYKSLFLPNTILTVLKNTVYLEESSYSSSYSTILVIHHLVHFQSTHMKIFLLFKPVHICIQQWNVKRNSEISKHFLAGEE